MYCSQISTAELSGGRCPLSLIPVDGICQANRGCLQSACGRERFKIACISRENRELLICVNNAFVLRKGARINLAPFLSRLFSKSFPTRPRYPLGGRRSDTMRRSVFRLGNYVPILSQHSSPPCSALLFGLFSAFRLVYARF